MATSTRPVRPPNALPRNGGGRSRTGVGEDERRGDFGAGVQAAARTTPNTGRFMLDQRAPPQFRLRDTGGMSQENVEILRRAIEAFNRGDFVGLDE
jgi:hypothetical protein